MHQHGRPGTLDSYTHVYHGVKNSPWKKYMSCVIGELSLYLLCVGGMFNQHASPLLFSCTRIKFKLDVYRDAKNISILRQRL